MDMFHEGYVHGGYRLNQPLNLLMCGEVRKLELDANKSTYLLPPLLKLVTLKTC